MIGFILRWLSALLDAPADDPEADRGRFGGRRSRRTPRALKFGDRVKVAIIKKR